MWSDPARPVPAASLSRRAALRLAAGGGAAALAGCGFTPVYAPGAPALVLRDAVRPDPPTDAMDVAFATRVEARLGAARTPRFALGYRISTRREGLGVTPSLSILRYSLFGRADFSLREIEGGAVLTSGRVRNFTDYSAVGTTVATRASQRDAETRLAVILADDVIAELLATAPGWAQGGARAQAQAQDAAEGRAP